MMGYESMEISAQTRLLMIDDDEKLCRRMRAIWNHLAMLSKPNTPVRRVARAASESFHAILLEGMLPGMGGFEVLQQLLHRCN